LSYRLVVILFAGGLLNMAFFSLPAFSQVTTIEEPVRVFCQGPGQLCSPMHSTTVTSEGVLRIRFIALARHCSSIRIHIFLDGTQAGTSDWLGYNGDPQGRPLETDTFDLGPVAPGSHEFAIQAEGEVGGCNFGNLTNWGGTLYLTVSEEPVQIRISSWGRIKSVYR